MPLFMGIDGGGSKTTCAIGDDTNVMARAISGGSNIIRLGEEQAKASLREAISRACEEAGVSPLKIEAVCVGAAGAGNPEVNEAMRHLVSHILPRSEVKVAGDMVIALESALGEQEGVVTIAGTGSIAFGRHGKGHTARAGGWGHAISDQGSGHWIGREAVSAVMAARDRNRETSLTAKILHKWTLSTSDELVRKANAAPTPNFAELFPVVEQAALEGDAMAQGILALAGGELAELALTVMRNLWKEGEAVRVGVSGGVFAHSRHVRCSFSLAVQRGFRGAAVLLKAFDPVIGALWLARKMRGTASEIAV